MASHSNDRKTVVIPQPDKDVKGTCPTCRKRYKLRSDGLLRRHGSSHVCAYYDQLPAEVIPAVFLLADLDGGRDESSGRS